MRAFAAVNIARRIDQRSAKTLRRDADVEGNRLACDHGLLAPRSAAVERAVEGDGVRRVVIPGYVKLTIGSHEGHCADGSTGSLGIVGAVGCEGRSLIAGAGNADSTGCRSADSRIPSDVHVVAEGRLGIQVGRDHRLV